MGKDKRIIRSACRMCHGVCQVLVHMEGERVVKITGDPESPVSRGYLCPKGAASPELLYHPDRLIYPLRRAGKRGENKWKRISWEKALEEIAQRFAAIKAESGSEYVAIVQGTGRPLIEFTVRFANAFGTPNFVSVGHVCYLPRVAASKITMGQLPVTDVYGFGGKDPECMVIWGCNITHSGSADGMCGGMIERALKRAGKVIVVDPRRTRPAKDATHWLQIRPGTDGALALAMIHVIITEGLIDEDFVHHYTVGYEQLAEHIKPFTPEWAAPITRIPPEEIRAAARTYATSSPACMLWGSATDASASNYQTARSLLILRALTGNIDRPGGDVLWVPPKGVHQKSIFMSYEQDGAQFLPPDKINRAVTLGKYPLERSIHPPTFWKSVVTGEPYRVRAIWIAACNPLLSQTHPLVTEKALRDHLKFTVASEFFMTPTAALADIVLPSAMWLETDDVVNLHKIWCVLARKKVAQIGEVRDVREVILELAKRLDLEFAFPWEDYRAYLEWLLRDSGMTFDEFSARGILQGEMRYYKYKENGFDTPSGKFEIYSSISEALGLSPLPQYREPALSPISSPQTAREYPLILTTGARSKVFFVSEGRQIDSLRKANPDPVVEVNPTTAQSMGIAEGDWVWIETVENRVKMRARFFDGIAHDVVSAQHAWWFPEEGPPEYGWKISNVNLLFGDTAGYDPETGSECLRSSLCKIYKAEAPTNS
jgi:anaerobic selenocysteine-containing dehydrogenase